MIPAVVVFAYLAIALYIGIFAFRSSRGRADAEDYFLAGRSLGPAVFLLSLFGANMTAFSILGASGHAFANGIVTFGLMASSSALVIPICLLVIGTRLWALGRRHGFMTPVQMFRDRWECGHIGTVIFAVQAVLLVPYIIIAVMGGGTTLAAVSGGVIPFWLGGAIVSLVVMGYVFFGGMRGTAWVNTLQTVLFLMFGTIAVVVIGAGMGGFSAAMESLAGSPSTAPLLTRERFAPLYFLSYTFIPLSSIAFPHIGIFCLTARRLEHFRKTVILYPLCMLAIWLPSVFLGVSANAAREVPAIEAKLEARAEIASAGPALAPAERDRLRAQAGGDDVILRLVDGYAPVWLAAHPRRVRHGGGDGERFADPRAVHDVYRRRVRVLWRESPVWPGRPGDHRPHLRRADYARGLCDRDADAAVDLRHRDAVRVRRLLGALAAAGRGDLLEAAARSGARWRARSGRRPRWSAWRSSSNRSRRRRPAAPYPCGPRWASTSSPAPRRARWSSASCRSCR